jgi:hypothetical protein
MNPAENQIDIYIDLVRLIGMQDIENGENR